MLELFTIINIAIASVMISDDYDSIKHYQANSGQVEEFRICSSEDLDIENS